jgi:hypothetical protein
VKLVRTQGMALDSLGTNLFHTSELHERPWEPTQAPCLSTGGSCPPPGNHHQDGPTSVQNPKWPHSGPREQGCSSAQNPVVVADWCDSGAGFMLGEHIPKVLGGEAGALGGLGAGARKGVHEIVVTSVITAWQPCAQCTLCIW